jgi:cytidylate kinase
MAIITISRGSYSKGKQVAEKVAEKLGYQCVAREVVIGASKDFNIPEVKLARALHDAPTILERITYGKERYVAYFQAAFLKYMQRDNVVYHGLAGHFFLKDVAHTLKVRIIANIEDRVREEMERRNISREAALAARKKDDEERRKWSLHLYGIDTSDSSLYDLIVRINRLSADDAADVICCAAEREVFKTTYESQKALDDLAVAAEVRAALVNLKPDVQVVARDGKVIVGTRSTLIKEPGLVREIETIVMNVAGVKGVEVKVAHLVDWSD